MRRVSYLGVVVLSLAVCWAAWGQDPGPGIGELPPPSPDLPISAGQPATHPFAAMSGQAAASRVLFEGAGPNNTEIVIREMLIGPGADVRLDALRGPALVDPRSGAGTLRAGDRSEQLQISTAISVESAPRRRATAFAGSPTCQPGIPIEITNDGDNSLMLRLYIVETR